MAAISGVNAFDITRLAVPSLYVRRRKFDADGRKNGAFSHRRRRRRLRFLAADRPNGKAASIKLQRLY